MVSLLAFASAFVFGMKGFGLSNEKVHLLSFSVEFRHFFSGRDFCGSGEGAELPFFTIENTKSQFFWEGGGMSLPAHLLNSTLLSLITN